MGGNTTMIAVGVGCRKGCSTSEIFGLVSDALGRSGCTADVLAAPALKADEPGVREAAALLALPLVLIAADALAAAPCVTNSDIARRHTGAGSAAEAAALAAVGPGARLLLSRIATARATCAVAEGEGA